MNTNLSEAAPNKMTFFFGANNPLSNWHPAKFIVKQKVFFSAEQYMMYCKAKLFKDEVVAERIFARSDAGPAEHKRLGRAVRGFDDAVWVKKRVGYVFTGCVAKFSQNEALGDYLLRTGETELVEASPYDRIWGVGLAENDPRIADRSKWRGENLLGQVLMAVRDRLRGVNADGTIDDAVRRPLVERLGKKESELLERYYDCALPGNEGNEEQIRLDLSNSIVELTTMLGRTAMCHEVDFELWSVFSDTFKDRAGGRPQSPWTVSAVTNWLAEEKKMPESNSDADRN